MFRFYATSSRYPIHPRLANLGGSLPKSLDHFMQRQKALSLWREILRAAHQIADPQQRAEIRDFARSEFERRKHVDDLTHIRYLLSTGREQFESMRRYVDMQGI